MLLAIDTGNTNAKFSLVDDSGEILHRWRIATDARRTADEYAVWLDQLIQMAGYKRSDIDAVIIATVVPRALHNLQLLAHKYFGVDALVAGREPVTWGIAGSGRGSGGHRNRSAFRPCPIARASTRIATPDGSRPLIGSRRMRVAALSLAISAGLLLSGCGFNVSGSGDGGAAAAMSGCMGAALFLMVVRYSRGKKANLDRDGELAAAEQKLDAQLQALEQAVEVVDQK